MTLYMLYVMGFAFAMSLAFTGFMIHAGVGDVPENRSNHKAITPTAGGVGIVAGLGGLILILPQFFVPTFLSPDWPLILTSMWAIGLLGLIDDVFPIPAVLKFCLMIVVAGMAVRVVGPVTVLPYAAEGFAIPYWAGFAGSLLWIFAVTNAVNFIDGSNGLMAMIMMLASLGLAVVAAVIGAPQAMLIPLGLAAGLAGFLPYNLRGKALIFSGDVGSLFTGFSFALAVLMLCREKPDAMPVFIGPVLILPLLTDVLLTMLRRAKHGENLLAPHRKHIYQRLITHGHGHVAIAIYYGIITAALAIFAVMLAQMGHHRFTAFFIFPAILMSAVYYVLVRRLKARAISKRKPNRP